MKLKLKDLFNGYIDAQKYKRVMFWFGERKFDVLTSQFNYKLFCEKFGNYEVIGLRDFHDCLSVDIKKPFWKF